MFDHHDINPELYEAKFSKRGFFWRLLVLFERMTFFFADVVISTNESYRKIAIVRGHKPPDRVFVVRSGPDLRRVKIAPVDPRWKKGRRYLVGFVGVIGDQEGIDLLLAAVKHLVFEMGRKDIQFVLVGDGPSRKRMESLSVEMGLADYVTFLGRAPDAELFSVLSSADVCVNPDRVNPMNNLSTMNKILEYMAMKKAIVQFDVVEGRVSAGDASLYAKPNDPVDFAEKIVELLADPAALRTDGRDRPRADRGRTLVGPSGAGSGEGVRNALRAALRRAPLTGDRPRAHQLRLGFLGRWPFDRENGGFRREVQPRRQHWFLNEKSGFPFRTPAFCSVSRGRRRLGEKEYRAPSVTPGLDSGAKRNGVKRSGFERPFQARQVRLGMAS